MSRILVSTIVLFASIPAFSSPLCAPITDVSCSAYPEQAQIIAKVAAVETSVVNGESVCVVTLDAPRHYAAHGLCPLADDQNLQYTVCDVCPEVGTEVSGVIMRDVNGNAVLD